MELSCSEDAYTVGIDPQVYPREAVTKAAYLFLDRCYVYLFHDTQGDLKVRFKAKPQARVELSHLVDEFFNELLNQSIRLEIVTKSRNLRELIMARALYVECLEAGQDGDLPYEASPTSAVDPLGIGKNWFENGGIPEQ